MQNRLTFSTKLKKTKTYYLVAALSAALSFASCSGAQHHVSSTSKSLMALGDTVPALGNNIMTIFQDSRKTYWFGSWESGVYRYDGNTLININTQHGLISNRIDEIREDSSGSIYFNCSASNTTIMKLDSTGLSALTPEPSSQWKNEKNDLWFRAAGKAGHIYRFDGKVLHDLTFPEHPTLHEPFEVYSIYRDQQGYMWFGTNPLGVCRWNGATHDWISESDVTELHDGPANGVRSIAQDREGMFWFNTLYRYKVNDNSVNAAQFYTKEKNIGNLEGTADGVLTEYLSIVSDEQQHLWIVTYKNGVWEFDGNNTIQHHIHENGKPIPLFSVYKDLEGSLWLGSPEHGAWKWNGASFVPFKP